jgi:hypothetical protein
VAITKLGKQVAITKLREQVEITKLGEEIRSSNGDLLYRLGVARPFLMLEAFF